MNENDFLTMFRMLTTYAHFPWQWELFQRFYAGEFPASCNLPTGIGKTSVIPIWLMALAENPSVVPRRLVYVVNRRTVVDQATMEAENLRERLTCIPELKARLKDLCAVATEDTPLAISTLRGQFANNGDWRSDPARPAIIIGTVDMIGSRLLFNGYGLGFKTRPMHAGFLGQDVLLIHDEAHLEPAFQKLIFDIEREQQRCKEFQRFRVIELSATSRNNIESFKLTQAEKNPPAAIPDQPTKPLHVVWRRLKSRKSIRFIPVDDEKKELAEKICTLALDRFKHSGRAILIFVRTVDDVQKIVAKLKKEGQNAKQLTGTLRGLERDRMSDPRRTDSCPIFARFLKEPQNDVSENEQWKINPITGTVYLICTSAGEVGVNISSDHMICDLTTFESMAQRFGRVNRYGDLNDTEIHVVYPERFDEKHPLSPAREKTLELLRLLPHTADEGGAIVYDGSPTALDQLDANERKNAFAPMPLILPATDILFDSWAMTTIRKKLPGRPQVEPYLHGIAEWQLPESFVAWRKEVGIITEDLRALYKPEELLEEYPIKPHEQLRDRSDRVFNHLVGIADRNPDKPAWLLDEFGNVEVLTLGELAKKENKDRIKYRTILLPPEAGGLRDGLLDGGSQHNNDLLYDVSDEWFADKQCAVRCRIRVWDDDLDAQLKSEGMRLVCSIDTRPDADEFDEEAETANRRYWHWYILPQAADDDLSRTARRPIAWNNHTADVVANIRQIVKKLNLSSDLQRAMLLVAQLHDLGKKRIIWQRCIGNPNPADWHAKSGREWKPIDITYYRHEFGSLLDLLDAKLPYYDEFCRLTDDMKDLVLHVIATHHGRGRPHFPPDEAFDPERPQGDADRFAVEIPRRFGRLQRKYGRWGLAYLESLLRAADHAASVNPQQMEGKSEES